MTARGRLHQLASMPPEWLEICSGFGAIVWGLGWWHGLALITQAGRWSPYAMLAALPGWMETMLIAAAIGAGVVAIGAAWVNEARLRYSACSCVSVQFCLIGVYVGHHAGFGPTLAIYAVLGLQPAIAMGLLLYSGWVRT